jgi:adenine-specific DNA-methyltransferase
VTETFCRRSRYFRPENGMRIDAVRAGIDRLELDPIERGLLLTSLVEAADRVDSTCGVQMAYLKRWAARAANPLALREPDVIAGPAGAVACGDANGLAGALAGIDLAYVDPPYNQHSYLGNYHVWETLVRGDRPEHYGVACKRADCRTRKSAYNSRREAWTVLADLIDSLATPWVIVSVSDEGFHDPADVEGRLRERGYVGAIQFDFKRYVGAQIGIHNPAGERVGAVSHLRNTEWLFVCGPDRSAVERALAAAPGNSRRPLPV